MKKTLWRLVLPVCLTAAAAQAQEAKLIVIGGEAQTENAVSVAGDGQVSPATAAVSQEQEKTAAPVSDDVEGKTVSAEQSAGNSSENAVSGAVPGDNSEEGDASTEMNGKMKRFPGLPSNREKKRRSERKPAPMPGRRLPNRLRERSLKQNRQQKLPRKRSL